MASVKEPEVATTRRGTRSFKFEQFEPPSGWTEDPKCHYLLLDLPGFKKDEVKFEVDNGGYIKMDGITGRFEKDILYIVTIPKLVEGQNEQEDPQNDGSDEDREACYLDQELQDQMLAMKASRLTGAMKMLSRNKGIIVTAILAFYLGILVSSKFQSLAQDWKSPTM
ncbi:hypothetical protein RJ641_014500 [Dillenia turbinata]|uniref:SHSP domain-containing protein n=1 Tax=Dillenia turbinata TaxID=194707 RepID=A0AAN8Z1F3_9MAGN